MAHDRVAVLCGGPSAEHEISIRSGDSLVAWLSQAGLEVTVACWRRDGRLSAVRIAPGQASGDEATRCESAEPAPPLAEGLARVVNEVDAVFPIVHGSMGEDGSIQGLLRIFGKPCVGPGVLASALAMDKARTKALLSASTGLRMPAGRVVDRDAWRRDADAELAALAGLRAPWVVKPVDGGSSVGLSRVEEAGGLSTAIEQALAVDSTRGALVEEFVVGVEVTCALFGNPATGVTALPPILIRPRHGGLFDYEAKYQPGGSEEICPAPLPAAVNARIQSAARAAYSAIGCRGFARVDFILRDAEPWFLELNTLPGLTRESLFPKAARAGGFELPELFRRLVELALEQSSMGVATSS